MMQRAEAGKNDHVWEFPGGKIDGDESPFEAAKREWLEEVGLPWPDGHAGPKWKDGAYRGFVWIIAREADLDLLNRKDPENGEVLAWWDVKDAKKNPALRAELDDSMGKWTDAVEKFYPSYTMSDLHKGTSNLVDAIGVLRDLFSERLPKEAADKINSHFDKALSLLRVNKGDVAGHEFHGNRYTGGKGAEERAFWARIQAANDRSGVPLEETRDKFTDRVKDAAASVKNYALSMMQGPDTGLKAAVAVSVVRAVAGGIALAAGYGVLNPGTHIPMDMPAHVSDNPPMITNPDSPPVPIGDPQYEPPPLSNYTPEPPAWATQHLYGKGAFFAAKGDVPGHEFHGNQWTRTAGEIPNASGRGVITARGAAALDAAAASSKDYVDRLRRETAEARAKQPDHGMSVSDTIRHNEQVLGKPYTRDTKVPSAIVDRNGNIQTDPKVLMQWHTQGPESVGDVKPFTRPSAGDQTPRLSSERHPEGDYVHGMRMYGSKGPDVISHTEWWHADPPASVVKGDSPGHPFRGNQYSGQIGSMAEGGRWMPENDDHAAALERLVAIPSAGAKTIDGEEVKDAIPQQLQPTPYSKDDIEAAIRTAGSVLQSDESVKVSELHGTNPYVSRRSIASAMKGAVQGPGGSHYRPGYKVQVAVINGQKYVLDGNHRANAAAVLGQDKVEAVVFRPQMTPRQMANFANRPGVNAQVRAETSSGH